jgi:hypothetical protein
MVNNLPDRIIGYVEKDYRGLKSVWFGAFASQKTDNDLLSCATYRPGFKFFQGVCAMARQFIYVMKGLSKVYPGGKKVLDNVWLSFTLTPRSVCWV